MKLYIVADMEGATGVVHRDDLVPEGGADYQRGCRLLTGDVNAAIEGAVDEGVTEVVVSEGHAHMRNVDIESLHPAARLVRGPASFANKPLCQVQALDDRFDLAFFVGFHSRAGTAGGLLSHTWMGAMVHEITLDGRVVGETAMNAAICARHGVPVGLVTGADDLVREARADLGDDVEAVEVKRALGRNIAACAPPAATAPAIREAAARAVRRHQQDPRPLYPTASPAVAELEVHRREMLDRVALVPGVERVGPRRVRVSAPDAAAALSLLWRCLTEAAHEPPGWLK